VTPIVAFEREKAARKGSVILVARSKYVNGALLAICRDLKNDPSN
jgi:hypothetical protein